MVGALGGKMGANGAPTGLQGVYRGSTVASDLRIWLPGLASRARGQFNKLNSKRLMKIKKIRSSEVQKK